MDKPEITEEHITFRRGEKAIRILFNGDMEVRGFDGKYPSMSTTLFGIVEEHLERVNKEGIGS